jgi:hypothetical protein
VIERRRALGAAKSGKVFVNVGNADVSGVVVELKSSFSIQGRFTIDGETGSNGPNLTTAAVILNPAREGEPIHGPRSSNQFQTTTPDGEFQLDNVREGEFLITVAGIPKDFYVKEVRMGQTDLLNRSFEARANGQSLTIVLSPAYGVIRGTVRDSSSLPNPRAHVVLIPDELPRRTDLYRTSVADDEGRFTINGVPPGTYQLFSWEFSDSFEYFDPTLVQRLRSLGLPVRIDDATQPEVDLRIISSNR